MASLDTEYGKNELAKVNYKTDAIRGSSTILRESPIFQAVLSTVLNELDKQQDYLLWLKDNILNLDVAEKWHLDFIGMFIGQARVLASFDTGVFYGFEGTYQSGTLGDKNDPSVGENWYNGNSYDVSTAKTLNDDQYKRILKARIIKNGTVSCSINDLLTVINLIVDNTDTVIYTIKHGHIQVKVNDPEGLFAYFLSRQHNTDNLLPIALGVRIELVE